MQSTYRVEQKQVRRGSSLLTPEARIRVATSWLTPLLTHPVLALFFIFQRQCKNSKKEEKYGDWGREISGLPERSNLRNASKMRRIRSANNLSGVFRAHLSSYVFYRVGQESGLGKQRKGFIVFGGFFLNFWAEFSKYVEIKHYSSSRLWSFPVRCPTKSNSNLLKLNPVVGTYVEHSRGRAMIGPPYVRVLLGLPIHSWGPKMLVFPKIGLRLVFCRCRRKFYLTLFGFFSFLLQVAGVVLPKSSLPNLWGG